MTDLRTIYGILFRGPHYALHPPDEPRYLAGLLPLQRIAGLRSLLDLGAGRGTFAALVRAQRPDVALRTVDFDKFHALDVEHVSLDLATAPTLPGPVDVATALDVLEHLPAAAIPAVLAEIARVATYAVFTVGMHSDVMGGVELHLTIRDLAWWRAMIGRDFAILRDWPYYDGRAAAFVVQSRCSPVVASVCLATHNKAATLARVLDGIRAQPVPFAYEVIVADDDSADHTDRICRDTLVQYVRVRREMHGYRNPAVARNAAYRLARAPIVIAQSDDVTHVGPDVIAKLALRTREGEARFARVVNVDASDYPREVYVGPENQRPLFFLGALWRDDLYAVGGNDEDFTEPGYEDLWFADCLARRGVRFVFDPAIEGHHHDHARPDLHAPYAAMRALWQLKRAAGVFTAASGAWT